MAKKGKKSVDYGVGSIKSLKGLEAVRVRPGMYLGDPSTGDALHHCVKEAVDNAVDEHLAGVCTQVQVELSEGGICTVTDDGRGIPVGIHPEEGVNTLQLIMTTLHAGGKFDENAYKEGSAGLHGVGISAVNAVSDWFRVEVHRDGDCWSQEYCEGKPTTAVIHEGTSDDRGTVVSWRRDLSVFHGAVEYDAVRIAEYLQELAFLNPGLTLVLVDSRGKKQKIKEFHYEGGIRTFVEELTQKKTAITPVLYFYDHLVQMALVWTDAQTEDVRAYANNVRTRDGGTHVSGFKNGLTRVVTKFAKEHGMLKDLKDGLMGSDIREGLTAVLSVRVKDLAFSSQTKDKLVTPSAKNTVETLFSDQVDFWLEKNPGIAKKIADRAVINARAREAARKAKADVIRKNYQDPLSLPGKLADCQSKNPADCELIICEGDSAGGTLKGARDRRFQAILPLRGKVLNVERAGLEQILNNEELGTIITALGCGMEPTRNFDIKRLRYHKIIILTDADVDGAHIRTLLLTLFYRAMPRLIWEGHVYAGVPPLYKATIRGRDKIFLTDEQEKDDFLDSLSPTQRSQVRISRYKGLGEMNAEELWATTVDPEVRVLKPITVADAVEAETAFSLLMGNQVDPRKEWILANAQFSGELDI